MKSLNKNENPIFVTFCFLCFQGKSFWILFDFTAAGVKGCLKVVKSLPLLYHSAVFISIFLKLIESIQVSWIMECHFIRCCGMGAYVSLRALRGRGAGRMYRCVLWGRM